MVSNMNQLLPFLWCFVVIASASEQFKVGETLGWRMPDENQTALYTQWASNNRFLVGDSLYFEYQNDSVLVVNKGSYYHCITANPVATFDDGKTVIKLEKPGPAYFISGAPDHCKNGQRLLVSVISLHPPSPPSPPSPLPSGESSPAPSPNQSSANLFSALRLSILVVASTVVMFV